MRPRKFRGGIGYMPSPHGYDPQAAAHDYHEQCGCHTHGHATEDPHHHIPPDCDEPVPGPEDGYEDGVEDPTGGWVTAPQRGVGGCSTGSCGVGALPDGTTVIKPQGMTRAGHRKFMKRLGKGRAQTSLTARRVARGMGIVATFKP